MIKPLLQQPVLSSFCENPSLQLKQSPPAHWVQFLAQFPLVSEIDKKIDRQTNWLIEKLSIWLVGRSVGEKVKYLFSKYIHFSFVGMWWRMILVEDTELKSLEYSRILWQPWTIQPIYSISGSKNNSFMLLLHCYIRPWSFSSSIRHPSLSCPVVII